MQHRRRHPHGHRPGHAPRAIGFLLNRAARRAGRSLEHELEPFELKVPHFVLLMTLARSGPRSQQQLGTWIGFDRTTMVALVDHLEQAGYASRERDPSDRRAYLVDLTDAGRELLPQLRTRASAAERTTLAPLTAEERRVFMDLLVKLVTAPEPEGR